MSGADGRGQLVRELLVASQAVLFGRVDVHVNLGYTFIGQPADVGTVMAPKAKNIINFALCGIVPLGKGFEGFAEVYGNTSASANGETGDAGGVVLPPSSRTARSSARSAAAGTSPTP